MKSISMLSIALLQIVFAQDYFPLKIGNAWTYTSYFDTLNKRVYSIKDTIRYNNQLYYTFDRNGTSVDTIRRDESGRIWKLRRGVDTLWFDFLKDSGSVYYLYSHNIYTYTVSVSKNLQVSTHLNKYSKCIELSFNIPLLVDDEISYTFSPEIGPIKIVGSKNDDLLFSAIINNSSLGVSTSSVESPNTIYLSQNYPNPFNPVTNINYQLLNTSRVNLTIYDALGRKIITLVDSEQEKGSYKVLFDARNLSSGIYYYLLNAGNNVISRKCVLLK